MIAGTGISGGGTLEADRTFNHDSHTGEVTGSTALTIANKQTLSATAPVTISNTPTVVGTAAPVIAMPAATASVNGYATSTQITKLDGITALADVTASNAPKAHDTSHQNGGADEISVTGLSGVLADDQHIIDAEAVSAMGTKADSNPLNHDIYTDAEAKTASVLSGAITNGETKAPTHDAVYDVKVTADAAQTSAEVTSLIGSTAPKAHDTSHQNGGTDEISVVGLSGLLADDQHVLDAEVQAISINTIAEDTSPQLGGDLDCNSHGINMGDQVLDQPKLRDYGETVSAIGSDTTPTLNLENGNVFTDTIATGTTTFTFSNPPASGTAGSFTLILTNGGSQTVNWPGSVKWAGSTAPSLTTSGVDILTFITINAGTTWYGFSAGLEMS